MPATLYPPLSSEGDVLPAELKARFELIQDIARAQRQLQEQQQQQGKGNDGKRIESKVLTDIEAEARELEQRKLRLAAETAVACENEISRLAKGVAELEELLARQGEGQPIDPVDISYPSLPSVIPNDDDEVETMPKGTKTSGNS